MHDPINPVSNPAMYLIMDYGTKEAKADSPIVGLRMANSRKVWEEVDRAKEDGLLIAVYKIGDCLLDWS